MKNQAVRRNDPQSGNVFFIIFLGIALFAALSYVVAQSMRTGSADISNERLNLSSSELLDYAQKLRVNIKELMISNECTDTQITFEGATYYSPSVTYTNTNAPVSKKCHLFDPLGGSMRLITPGKAAAGSGYSLFVGRHCYEDIGSGPLPCPDTSKELEYNLVDIPLSLCQKINELSGVTAAAATPPQDDYNADTTTGFTGTYLITDSAATTISIGAPGKTFGCFQDNSGTLSGKYIFFYILLER